MATTVTALWCTAGHAIVLHAGDSRAYRLRAGALVQLTQDHTLAADYRRRHDHVPPEITRLYGHVLTRAVSARWEDVNVDVWFEPLEDGDEFMLCTDGLTLGVSDAEIAVLMGASEGRSAVHTLVRAANDAGGSDNVTVAIARWRSAPRHPS